MKEDSSARPVTQTEAKDLTKKIMHRKLL